MDQVLNKSALTPEELSDLHDKYDCKNNQKVNYRDFCANINKGRDKNINIAIYMIISIVIFLIAFPDKDLTDDPKNHIYQSPEYLGTLRSMTKLNEEEEIELKSLLTTINNYCAKRNLDLLEKFRDFDRNKIGILTESQFIRCMDQPSLKQVIIHL